MSPQRHQRLRHGKYFWLLCALLIMLVLAPILDDDEWGPSVIGVMGMLTLVLALRAIAGEKRILYVGIGFGVVAYTLNCLAAFSDASILIALPFQFAFYGYINLCILRAVLEAKHVDGDIICGGICVYLLLGINWALVFAFIEFASPGSLRATNDLDPNGVSTPLDFVYFSYVTLTTLGYGDIVPVSRAARACAMAAAVSGTLFIAVFIGSLVGLTISQRHSPSE